jgi:hypothetical protein
VAGLPACNQSVASVAQLVEQLTLNQLVLGSSPSRGTIFLKGMLSPATFKSNRIIALADEAASSG